MNPENSAFHAGFRYYSVERSGWEELPLTLVDFQATERAEKQKQQEKEKILLEAAKTEKDTYQLPQGSGYEIAPGIRLPSNEGIYAYDGTRVITLLQSQGSLARDKKRLALNIVLPAPILKSRTIVILPGRTAAVRILNRQLVFYAQFADGAGANLELLRLNDGTNDREVENIGSRLGGKPSESHSSFPLTRKQLAPGLFELKPGQPLAPGEYALGEVSQDKLNLDVWDFGIGSPKKAAP